MSSTKPTITAIPAAMPISRILRFALGAALVAMVVPPLLGASNPARLKVAAVFVALVVLYALVHLLVCRFFGSVNPYAGALIAVAPVTVMALFGGIFAAGAVLYIGVSLLLIAATGDPGCEVLAIQAMFSRQPTHLACLLFSPLDWVETRVGRLFGRSAGA